MARKFEVVLTEAQEREVAKAPTGVWDRTAARNIFEQLKTQMAGSPPKPERATFLVDLSDLTDADIAALRTYGNGARVSTLRALAQLVKEQLPPPPLVVGDRVRDTQSVDASGTIVAISADGDVPPKTWAVVRLEGRVAVPPFMQVPVERLERLS